MTFDVHAHVIVPEITGDEAWRPRVYRDDGGSQVVEMGAAGFLRKPIRKEVLVPKVRGILKRSGRHAAASD